MIRSFADWTTSDIFGGLNTKNALRIPQSVWGTARRKLDVLNAATSTLDLTLPGMAFEPLKHDLPGCNSIRINDQFRIIFRFEKGDAFDVAIRDFHGRHST